MSGRARTIPLGRCGRQAGIPTCSQRPFDAPQAPRWCSITKLSISGSSLRERAKIRVAVCDRLSRQPWSSPGRAHGVGGTHSCPRTASHGQRSRCIRGDRPCPRQMRTFTPDADCINMQFELPASDPVASGAAAKAAHLAAVMVG
jgi:hypothetical protein